MLFKKILGSTGKWIGPNLQPNGLKALMPMNKNLNLF